MDIFTTVKAAVTVKQAAEHYGLQVSRNSTACCPFHDDRHPSMKLNERYFYCFGCGATCDVIDLVAKTFDLSSYEAAKKLAYDFGIDPDKPPAAIALPEPERPLLKAYRQEEVRACGYCTIICIFWKAGRCSTHPRHRKMFWMTGLWKPARCWTMWSTWQICSWHRAGTAGKNRRNAEQRWPDRRFGGTAGEIEKGGSYP